MCRRLQVPLAWWARGSPATGPVGVSPADAMRTLRRRRSVAVAGLWLALAAAVLGACAGVEDRAHAYYEAEYRLAPRIELDPADEARFLRSFADGLERDQAGFVRRARAGGPWKRSSRRARTPWWRNGEHGRRRWKPTRSCTC